MQSQAPIAVTRPWLEYIRQFRVDGGARLLHAFKTAIAVIIGTGLCMRLEFPLPRTAMVSIVILMMHQQSGMVIARGFYRFVGMAAGSAFGLLLVACFAQQPLPFYLALAGWIGVCVWGASYYRNFQSYGYVLAGYAAAIIVAPAWSDPYGSFDNVVCRLSEVMVGVICASAVSALVFPQQVGTALLSAGAQHASDLIVFARRMLGEKLAEEDLYALHLKLVSDRAQIEALRSAAVFEDPSLRLSNPLMVQLNRDFLDTAASLHSLRRALQRSDEQILSKAAALASEAAALLSEKKAADPLTIDEARTMHGRIVHFLKTALRNFSGLAHTLPEDGSTEGRERSAVLMLCFAMEDLSSYLQDFVALHTFSYAMPERRSGVPKVDRIVSTANHLAARAAGLRAFAAVALVAAFWIASGWTSGATAVVAVSITSALFAIAPHPVMASRQTLLGCLLGAAAAFVCKFLLLPGMDGFPLLACTLMPFIMLGSYLGTLQKTAVLGVAFNIYFCFVGDFTNPITYSPAAFLDQAFSLLLGIGAAALAFAVVAPSGNAWVNRSYRQQISRFAAGFVLGRSGERDALLRFESGLRDFVLQIASQPAQGVAERKDLLNWTFAVLEMGRTAIQVRSAADVALPSQAWRIDQAAWQQAMAALFEQVTSARHAAALTATRQALNGIPPTDPTDNSPSARANLRISTWLCATELLLMDDTQPFHPVARGAA
ncbi:FUSC family protein [Dyella choica]|uniref:FUSC family protein n=1 Tax=Dyella choica TaxID=1927959 RepID=A0A432MB51_9GAMM|nr:FUSC family protein [Dyella choica]RUL78982.1 FUSC family protein [Dyella choica]